MIHVSHPVGSVFVRALLQGLKRAGCDYLFHTSVGLAEETRWTRHLPGRLRDEADRRRYPIPASRLCGRPLRELGRLAARRFKWESLIAHEYGPLSVDAVTRDLDSQVALRLETSAHEGGGGAAHAYEDGALATFTAAKHCGMVCSYELPIAHWKLSQKLLREEAQRWPAWEPTLHGTRDSAQKLERKTRELDLADVVICPSRFVLDSLPEDVRRSKRCVIAEFGSPASVDVENEKAPTADRPLRLLFAGSLSQRKGLADLFAAMKLLDRTDVELVVLGGLAAPMSFYRRQYAHFSYEAPRPHEGVLALMKTCDVLVLPSIVEGRALVQQEAMQAGLPLIVTSHAGAEELVEEGETGFLVPIRSPESIAERICWFADHREAIPEMARQARTRASMFTWQDYSRKILQTLDAVA